MTILIFFAVLFVLVLVHEFGHFITAKWAKMRVDEFAIGFPPRLFSLTKGETTYAFNLLPIGGYVKIYGENGEDSETPDTPRAFSHKPAYAQAIVLVAGVAMNILLAFLLYTTTNYMGVTTAVSEEERTERTTLRVASVLDGSPAEVSGVRVGDQILSLNYSIENEQQVSAQLTPSGIASFIQERGEAPLSLTALNNSGEYTKTLQPVRMSPPGGGEALPRVGFVTSLVETRSYGIGESISRGASDTVGGLVAITKGVWELLSRTVSGTASMQDVTGPIGIAGMVGEASKFGISTLMTFTAFISLNLAVINMLPIPALDGGRLLMVGIEALRGRPLNQRMVGTFNLIGFALLMLLMLVVTVGDIGKLIK
jgi:regulator of sigma E protease